MRQTWRVGLKSVAVDEKDLKKTWRNLAKKLRLRQVIVKDESFRCKGL